MGTPSWADTIPPAAASRYRHRQRHRRTAAVMGRLVTAPSKASALADSRPRLGVGLGRPGMMAGCRRPRNRRRLGPDAPYERRLHRWRAPAAGPQALLPATALYLVLLSPYLVSRFAAQQAAVVHRPDRLPRRRPGGADGGHDLYRFASADVHLPFTYPPFAALLSPWLAWLPPLADVLIWTAAELVTIVWLTSVGFRPLLARAGSGRPYLLAALAAARHLAQPGARRDQVRPGRPVPHGHGRRRPDREADPLAARAADRAGDRDQADAGAVHPVPLADRAGARLLSSPQ